MSGTFVVITSYHLFSCVIIKIETVFWFLWCDDTWCLLAAVLPLHTVSCWNSLGESRALQHVSEARHRMHGVFCFITRVSFSATNSAVINTNPRRARRGRGETHWHLFAAEFTGSCAWVVSCPHICDYRLFLRCPGCVCVQSLFLPLQTGLWSLQAAKTSATLWQLMVLLPWRT